MNSPVDYLTVVIRMPSDPASRQAITHTLSIGTDFNGGEVTAMSMEDEITINELLEQALDEQGMQDCMEDARRKAKLMHVAAEEMKNYPIAQLVSDSELLEVAAGAEKEIADDVFYFLGGHAERENKSVIEEFLSRHPLNPNIASMVAEALYGKDGFMEDRQKYIDTLAITANAEIKSLSNDACLTIGVEYYKTGEYEKAFPWMKRASEVFNSVEAGIAMCEMYEDGKFLKKDLVEAARWLLKASLSIKYDEIELNYIFMLDELAFDSNGKWVDIKLLKEWVSQLDAEQRKELLNVITSVKSASKKVKKVFADADRPTIAAAG